MLKVELIIPGSHSLKEKRQVVRSLKDQLKNRFNVSLAEVDGLDTWQRSVLAMAKVDLESAQVDSTFSHIVDFIERFNRVELRDYETEML